MRGVFIALITGICIALSAQSDTVRIDFVEADPEWEHLVYDPNNLGSGRYTSLNPYRCIRNGDSLYLITHTVAPNADSYGYVLQSVDLNTGEPHWIKYNTFYNNDTSQEYIKETHLIDNRYLELLGTKRPGPLPPNQDLGEAWFWDPNSILFRRLYDMDTGEIVSEAQGADTIGGSVFTGYGYGPVLSQFPYEHDNRYLFIRQRDFIIDDTRHYGYAFYHMNASHTIDPKVPYDTVLYVTPDSLTYGSINATFYILELNGGSHLAAIVMQHRYDPELYKFQFLIMDISDWNQVEVVKRVNLEDVIPRSNRDFTSFGYVARDDQVFITHQYGNDDLQAYVSYLMWLNDLIFTYKV